jgi:hypothetical protein
MAALVGVSRSYVKGYAKRGDVFLQMAAFVGVSRSYVKGYANAFCIPTHYCAPSIHLQPIM